MTQQFNQCNHTAEIAPQNGQPVGPWFICTRQAGHSGECSREITGFTSHNHKRVETVLKVHWPSKKMLRRKLDGPK